MPVDRRARRAKSDGIDAELLAGVSRRLDEPHLQHHLLRAPHGHLVDHVRSVLLGKTHRSRGRGRVLDRTPQDGASIRRGDARARTGLDAFERLLEARDQDVYEWITGQAAAPDEYDTPTLALIRAFKNQVAQPE